MSQTYAVVIEERINNVTPGDILSLFQKYSISLYIESADPKDHHKGTLVVSRRTRWIIIVRKQERSQELHTLLHEFFHLILFDEGLDDLDGTQKYDDAIIENAVCNFVATYSHFSELLWDYVKDLRVKPFSH